jgi:UDP-glucose 4-epimerase
MATTLRAGERDEQMAKVMVTGGLGVIGPFVCRALLSSSRQPVIYDLRADTGLIKDIETRCVVATGNTCDLPRLMGVVGEHRPTAIIHLAGQVGPTVENYPWSALGSNLIGTATIFECARLAGIPRIVFASSTSVYGPVAQKHRHPGYEPVCEDHPREPVRHYSKMKRACEDLADHYAHLYGLDIIALRFGSAFGPGKLGIHDKVSPVIGLIEAAIACRPIRLESGADQRDDLCYSGEAANGVVAALDSPPRPGTFRAYNISSGELISLREMITVLRDIHPSWDGEAGPGLDYRGCGTAFYYQMSTQKARAEIGFRPIFDFRSAAIDYAHTLRRLTISTT